MKMPQDDFLKMEGISSVSYLLNDTRYKYYSTASLCVKSYVWKTRPELKNMELYVQFMWAPDGISVSYEYEVSGFGWPDGPEKRSEYFKLKYMDVFGWELPPAMSAKFVRQYTKSLIDNMFAGPNYNYEI